MVAVAVEVSVERREPVVAAVKEAAAVDRQVLNRKIRSRLSPAKR